MASPGQQSEPLDIRLLVDSIPALVHTARPDGYLDYFNKPWLEYLGVTLDDVIGWKWRAFIHPEDVEGIVHKWQASLATGEIFEYETRVRRADGEYRWMLHRKAPLRDERANIVKWYGSSMDIEDRKRAEEAQRRNESFLAEGQRLSHMGSWAFNLAGFAHWSASLFEIHGLDPSGKAPSLEEYMKLVHPEDREFVAQAFQKMFTERARFDFTRRIVRPDRKIRRVRCVGVPTTHKGTFQGFVGIGIDVTEQEQLTEELRRSEHYLAEAQRLGRTGSWGFNPSGYYDYWSEELFRIYGLDPRSGPPSLERYLACVHPQDRAFMAESIQKMVTEVSGCDLKKRILQPDGAVRYIRCVGEPLVEDGALKRIIGTAMDVTEQEQLTEELQRREAYLAEAQRLSHTGSFGWKVSSGEIFWSEETFRIFQCDPTTKPTVEFVLSRVHREDRDLVHQQIDRASRDGEGFDFELRLELPDRSIKHVRVTAHPSRDSSGDPEFVGAVTDVSEERRAEAVIREREGELRQILDLTPQHVGVLGADGSPLYVNRVALEYFGINIDQWRTEAALPQATHSWLGSRLDLVHPDDRERFLGGREKQFLAGEPHEFEARLRRHEGEFRWYLFRMNPLKDEQGHITRWYGTATDIEDRKRTEDRLRHENVALREEIDKASMFEEIVGASRVLQSVLSHISKVARSDSTVLIMGETGTGKELVARAIHRRSDRSSRAFVSVNCSAIPRDLVGSELFGHEKGAFTGATQRRLGRFELAGGGTIFLDEVGELPDETQLALLRVLQEREFERVGGTAPIRSDVRVIAATNRDLQMAIASGGFRSDLFYRLNVFPIDVPPLRERTEDIPMLVEYFIDRYARKAGKKFRGINKRSLELLCSYPWPGNIRELQNIIERSVVLSETETFSVDESWLSRQPLGVARSPRDLSRKPAAEQKEVIEAALRVSGGRVFGPSGAAAKLGIPRSTLESKIRSLNINKNLFKTSL